MSSAAVVTRRSGAILARGRRTEPEAALGAGDPARARDGGGAGDLALGRGPAVPDARHRADHRARGRAAGAHAGEPGAAGDDLHRPDAVRRPADDPAGRDRADAPAHAERAALHHRRRGRLHRGRRRANHDAARGFRDDAGLDLARSWQSRIRTGGVARRARYAVREHDGCDLSRGLSGRDPAGDAARRRCSSALRREPAPGRLPRAGSARRRSSRTPTSARARRSRGSREAGRRDPSHGYKLRYANPANGGHPFPTMAAFMQFLPERFAGRGYRSTESTVFCVVEGRGSAAIGEARFDFAPHDVFVVPSWEPYRLDAPGRMRALQLLGPRGAGSARLLARAQSALIPRSRMIFPQRATSSFRNVLASAGDVLRWIVPSRA